MGLKSTKLIWLQSNCVTVIKLILHDKQSEVIVTIKHNQILNWLLTNHNNNNQLIRKFNLVKVFFPPSSLAD